MAPYQDLDGITHATVTVDAICEGVRMSLGCIPEKRSCRYTLKI